MYAVVSVWQMEKSRAAEQEHVLHEMIVPSASRAPGFKVGYWTIDDATSTAHVMIVLETEEAARRFKEGVESNRPTRRSSGSGRRNSLSLGCWRTPRRLDPSAGWKVPLKTFG